MMNLNILETTLESSLFSRKNSHWTMKGWLLSNWNSEQMSFKVWVERLR